ncbi:MAG TPA: segregation/condensation protein A [Candidatus Paceibacterota bacterium]|nr:segregation/condensation protein A [Candidatus Paceibacterota bacterium]
MPITVKTPVYEGPLDLLLDLIEKRKLLINDISLAQVADEYISRVNTLAELPVGETAQFVSLAATLLLIKSRSLLPTLELSGEEERDIKELQYRLAVYQILKDAGRGLRQSFTSPMLWEGIARDPEPIFIPDESTTQDSLLRAAQTLIAGFPQLTRLPKVEVKKIISLEEMIERMSTRINSAMKMSFKEFVGKKERGDIIVGFLALLELVKQGIIRANQDKQYGDIQMESDAVSTPSYE